MHRVEQLTSDTSPVPALTAKFNRPTAQAVVLGPAVPRVRRRLEGQLILLGVKLIQWNSIETAWGKEYLAGLVQFFSFISLFQLSLKEISSKRHTYQYLKSEKENKIPKATHPNLGMFSATVPSDTCQAHTIINLPFKLREH